MNSLQVDGLCFEKFLSREEIAMDVHAMAQQIAGQFHDLESLYVIVVLQGAVPYAMDLACYLPEHILIDFISVQSYSGVHSSGKVKLNMDIKGEIQYRHVLLVEDIVDKGHTLNFLRQYLLSKNPRSLNTSTYLFKPDAYAYAHPPEFVGRAVGNEFVVGYGMDYNGQGRMLRDIYRAVKKNESSLD